MTIADGDTDLESGGLDEELEEGEIQTGEVAGGEDVPEGEEELDKELLREFDGASKDDFIKALKIYIVS